LLFYGVLVVVGVVAAVVIANQAANAPPTAITIDPNTPLPKAEGYLMGRADAPVQVLEFGDFECPVCSQFALLTEPDVRKRLIEPGQISMRYLDFPLDMHPNSWPASMAAACAHEQGKFWEMHDQLYSMQDQWSSQATQRPKPVFQRLARTIGLDIAKWESCFDTQKYKLQIAASQKEGQRRLVSATPTFVIGSKMIANTMGFDQFKAYVDSALAEVQSAAGAAAKQKGK
jgi:protein-disulfide isomerase